MRIRKTDKDAEEEDEGSIRRNNDVGQKREKNEIRRKRDKGEKEDGKEEGEKGTCIIKHAKFVVGC
jgi:hypothetical protein